MLGYACFLQRPAAAEASAAEAQEAEAEVKPSTVGHPPDDATNSVCAGPVMVSDGSEGGPPSFWREQQLMTAPSRHVSPIRLGAPVGGGGTGHHRHGRQAREASSAMMRRSVLKGISPTSPSARGMQLRLMRTNSAPNAARMAAKHTHDRGPASPELKKDV